MLKCQKITHFRIGLAEYKASEGKMKFFLSFLLAVVFCGLSFRKKWLNAKGSVLAAVFGLSLLYAGGWIWIVPVMMFFGTSSLLSKLGRQQADAQTETADHIRNGVQVMANGGVAWLLLIVHVLDPKTIWFIGFLGALAAATADTWGTEVGRLTNGRVWSVVRGRQVEVGESGGMSWQGTLAGVIGACLIAFTCYLWQEEDLNVLHLLIISGSGILGSLVDSILGSTLQVRFNNTRTGKISEVSNGSEGDTVFSGWRWMTNDTVNLICTCTGAACATILYSLFF